ncbi:hypothetical protein LOAG_11267 [Loa loa]|uniref:BZIP domain-containing protein n=1 Tax=Loa loa TaxID=7209 RepID=A0A1I7VHQ7_LOALO|nr:hypothetical protein LOAG_11267 [Loa loa]EFO17233.1 hypothetical protein LOAG_11267 [Loa loa]
MLAKIIVLLLLHIAIGHGEEKPFLDLKKVIRGALDVVAAVPTSPSANYDFGDVSKSNAPNGIHGIDPIIRERLSRIFHIPPDFVHRLAAQVGFIDYEPTTVKPFPNYRFKPKSHTSHGNQEYNTGSAFIQEDPTTIFNTANDLSSIIQQQGNFVNTSQIITNHAITEQQADILQSEQAIIFQPVIKDGHLYYQPFGVLPQGGQPKMIIYGGRLYMATPLQNEKHAQERTMGDMIGQYSSDVIDKKENDHKLSNEPNEEMHYRHIYAQHMKAAEDAKIQAAKLQQVIAPDASSTGILGIESKARTSSPYRKGYKKELERYDKLHQFNLQKKPQEVNANFAQENMAGKGQKRAVTNFRVTTPITSSFNQLADEIENSDSPSYQPSFNQNFKQSEEIDNIATDSAIEEQTTTTIRQSDKHQNGIFSPKKVKENENTEFMSTNQSMRRILALRRKMAADRKRFAERKRLLSSMKRKINKDDDMNKEIFRRHCYNIRSLAQQFGFMDIKQYVLSNCMFIENNYPEFKCDEADVSVDECERLFRVSNFN